MSFVVHESKRARIRGVLAPVVTPFRADLAPDRERFISHCRWLLSQNCGLAPFGTTSEANSMSTDERISLLDALVAAGIDPSRMMPGTGCCSISETVELTTHAVKHGCAGVLMLPPFYYKDITEEGLYRYFSEVVQRCRRCAPANLSLPYSAGSDRRDHTKIGRASPKAYPNTIAGMKDSSGDWNNTKTFSTHLPTPRIRLGLSSTCLSAANRSFSQICVMAVRARFPRRQT